MCQQKSHFKSKVPSVVRWIIILCATKKKKNVNKQTRADDQFLSCIPISERLKVKLEQEGGKGNWEFSFRHPSRELK